jgi:hypothetical protein
LEDLEPLAIDGAPSADIANRLWFLVSSLGIVRTSVKIGDGSGGIPCADL